MSARPAAGGAPDTAVWILDAGSPPRRVVVTAGQTDGTWTEATKGDLKEGDSVIVAALGRTPTTTGGGTGPRGGRGPGF